MEDTTAHYLTFSCYKRLWLFKDSHLNRLFVQTLQQVRERFEIELYAWVIMPNHVHLLLNLSVTTTPGRFFQSLKKSFAFQALRYLDDHYPETASELVIAKGRTQVRRFWQAGGGYDRGVRGADAIKKMGDYIHNNPVVKGYVEIPEDWIWSSARYWYHGDTSLMAMDDPGVW